MLDQLFFRSDALTRQLSAPLVDERCQYLAQCAAQGMARRTVRVKARLLLSIAEYLRLTERPDDLAVEIAGNVSVSGQVTFEAVAGIRLKVSPDSAPRPTLWEP
jgi:hypothetical protein